MTSRYDKSKGTWVNAFECIFVCDYLNSIKLVIYKFVYNKYRTFRLSPIE